jgi:hypothetical protein
MDRIIDVKSVQAALDRAASNAMHGSQDVRAGRFVAAAASAGLPLGRRRLKGKPDRSNGPSLDVVDARIEEGRRIAKRLREEARWAQLAWALWEALNGSANHERSDLRESLGYLGLSGQAGFLQSVLARDALLALFRLTDQAGDGLSLCAIVRQLSNDTLCTRLSDRDWLQANGCPDFLLDFEAREQPKRIEFIRDLVSPKWSDQCPRDGALYRLRARIKDVRDNILAHPLDSSSVVQPEVDEIRELLRLTTTLVEKTELLFLGSAQAIDSNFDDRVKQAGRLWDYFQEGPIGAHKHEIEARKKAGLE